MIPEINETTPPTSEAAIGNLENGPLRKPIQSVPLTDLQKQKLADLNWAAASPEVQEHSGKFVVIHKKKIVAVGDDYGKLLEQAAEQEQCPTWHLVVEVVPNWDEFWFDPNVTPNV